MNGSEAAADAGFMLAVLAATGIAAPHMPLNDTWAVQTLHIAARAGSQEAELALAHRYYFGDGVPASRQEGLRFAPCSAVEQLIYTKRDRFLFDRNKDRKYGAGVKTCSCRLWVCLRGQAAVSCCRRARNIADVFVSTADESSSPEVPLEPVSLRMRHRHGSYDDSSSQETWHQLQLQAEMFNL